jgi:hypothetical protein
MQSRALLRTIAEAVPLRQALTRSDIGFLVRALATSRGNHFFGVILLLIVSLPYDNCPCSLTRNTPRSFSGTGALSTAARGPELEQESLSSRLSGTTGAVSKGGPTCTIVDHSQSKLPTLAWPFQALVLADVAHPASCLPVRPLKVFGHPTCTCIPRFRADGTGCQG